MHPPFRLVKLHSLAGQGFLREFELKLWFISEIDIETRANVGGGFADMRNAKTFLCIGKPKPTTVEAHSLEHHDADGGLC